MGNKNRRRNNKRQSHNSAPRKVLPKTEIHGRKLKVSPHPPEFVPVPWYNLIVRIPDIVDISASSLATSIRGQLNLGPNNFIQFRIINIRIWGPLVAMNAAAPLSQIRASFWALTPANSTTSGGTFSVQEECLDYPDQVRRAAIGYEYPIAQQQFVFNQNSSQPVVHLTYGSGVGNVAYVKVLWRSSLTVFAAGDVTYDPISDKFVYAE